MGLIGVDKQIELAHKWYDSGSPAIIIHGPPGSGKKALAKHLAEKYNLEYTFADDIDEVERIIGSQTIDGRNRIVVFKPDKVKQFKWEKIVKLVNSMDDKGNRIVVSVENIYDINYKVRKHDRIADIGMYYPRYTVAAKRLMEEHGVPYDVAQTIARNNRSVRAQENAIKARSLSGGTTYRTLLGKMSDIVAKNITFDEFNATVAEMQNMLNWMIDNTHDPIIVEAVAKADLFMSRNLSSKYTKMVLIASGQPKLYIPMRYPTRYKIMSQSRSINNNVKAFIEAERIHCSFDSFCDNELDFMFKVATKDVEKEDDVELLESGKVKSNLKAWF